MKSENKNFIYNLVYQVFIYLFPLITIPYISRVLGVDNIGIYSYTYSIINCFMLFSMLGINNYGNREISKNRDDKNELSKKFISIYSLQVICGILMLCIYLLFLFFFCKNYRIIFLCQLINFISVFFDINWFYFGLEKFKLTITRNVIVKIISTCLIFILVNNSNDLIKYTIIMGTANLISQLYLFTQLRKYIVYVKTSKKEIMSHLKSCLILFIPVLSYSIYRIMDKTMIGFFSTVTELGYYENAEKIINIPIAVINALGTVMLPRMSYLIYKEKNNEKIKEQIYESLKLAMLLACNMFFGVILVADSGAIIIFGKDFAKSGIIMKLLSVTIVCSAWASVFRTQYLIPKSKDKIYTYTTIIGAILNLILNLIFIPQYGSIGACIGTIFAEAFLCFSQSTCINKEIHIVKYLKILVFEFIKACGIFCICVVLTKLIDNIYLQLIFQIVIYIFLFIIINKKYIVYDFLGKGRKCCENKN